MVSYDKTKVACYLGYITQAISINLIPLLYVTFQDEFSVTLGQLGIPATVIFVSQIVIDLLAVRFGRHLSYRGGCVAAHIFAVVGLLSFVFLPNWTSSPYVGILISSIVLSIGGGLIEVLISPVVDAIPGDAKAGDMSLLHSFYCWGVVGVALVSTAFFAVCGIDAWRWLVSLWALVPAVTAVLFCIVPIPQKPEELAEIKQSNSTSFIRHGVFWLLMALMLCSGATEMGPAQWASLFAERGLQVSKTMGDLLGPCAFALFQGLARILYARLTLRYNAGRILLLCAFGCIASYGLIVLSPWPILSLIGLCLCGLFVGPMWPGLLSICSARFNGGGTAMFASLALCGDLGCAFAPALVGFCSESMQSGGVMMSSALRGGFAVCVVFPVFLTIGLLLLQKNKRA